MSHSQRCEQTGKVRHSSEHLAKVRTRGVSNRLRAYRCPHCRDWHVTNGEHDGKRRPP